MPVKAKVKGFSAPNCGSIVVFHVEHSARRLLGSRGPLFWSC